MDAFLATSVLVDHHHPAVREFSATVRQSTEIETVRSAYEAVRDRFPHSYDISAQEVSVSASDVLLHGHGICFAKAHLLAATLRACGIAAGFCYQRLLLDDTDPTYTARSRRSIRNPSRRRADCRLRSPAGCSME